MPQIPLLGQLQDGTGLDHRARVTSRGQQVVAPYDFDTPGFMELAEPDTAYNFSIAGPAVGKCFVITSIDFRADKQVSNTVDAVVELYEATTATTLTVAKELRKWAVVEGDIISQNLNLLIGLGVFVNAKTTDDDIHITLGGYFVPFTQAATQIQS